ncbi:energy-coupling factor transporter transmembrane component T [Microbacterium sp. zg-Y818]|uniref:energy-coupling factor transporter transmembrane component T n=1 Tax=unclassified Microbacterium TaxID=2609290 RepID=UPI00214C627F|nr:MULTISPECIES: energy-coupling factor transporter transmembrane component T [unclassified Microbacterium]MCR2802023.1 energy-coupling factor transporter transmembrane protein EcfT [Microbacterium sp. zg.Y818]WIM22577.1 energy-coupling factor transporter transmembrane component T [Microbacterium sp. zg-Y818]
MTAVADPYAEARPAPAGRFLYGLNPLAKFAAPLPAMAALVFARDLTTPLVFLVLAYLVVIVGSRWTWRLAAVLVAAVPLGVLLVGFGMSVWVDAARVDGTAPVLQVGGWTLYSGALQIGMATALRLGAIVALALMAGLTTTGPDLVRALVQQLRVPYRVGYTALAAFRFVPRFRYELDVIRQAHRVRGSYGGRGPFAAVARGGGYLVPLLAGAIRHAERVALAMDSRAFGAYPDRTERHLVPWRVRDTVFVVVFWIVTAALLVVLAPWSA